MEPFKENIINRDMSFPFDVLLRDSDSVDIDAPPHWHDCCEILFMLEGSGLQQVNSKFFRVEQFDLIILNEGDIHSTYCDQCHTRILVIKYLPEFVKNDYSSLLEAKYIYTFMNNRQNQVCHLADIMKNSTRLFDVLMGIYNENTCKQTGYEICIKGYFYQLIAHLIRAGAIQNNVLPDNGSNFTEINKILKYIESNYKEKIDLARAASVMNLSHSYFSRYFKKVTGRSFKEYLDFVRVCEVEKLLLSSDISISQAAYEVGFCNVSSFNRVFRRIRGYSPGEIRKTMSDK